MSATAGALHVTAAIRPAAARATPTRRWVRPYLVAVTLLAPVVSPPGPGQTAAIDALNLAALVGFAAGLRRRPAPVHWPLLLPLFLMAAGSLMATAGAASLGTAGLALAQDLYLYVWFVMLVSLMEGPDDLRALRVAWFWTANGVALLGLALLPRSGIAQIPDLAGPRAASTLYNANMCADYLVLSVFNALGLMGQMRTRWLAPSLVLLAVALMATKSNGGWLSLCAGLVAWVLLRIAAGGPWSPWAAALMALVLAGVLVTGWSLWEWRSGASWARRVAGRSYLVRMEHSSDTRAQIWRSLGADLARSPLGIGPGNSASRDLAIGERLRPDSFRAKEAHSDYLAYAVERGPLALIGLLLAIGATFARVWGAGAALARRTTNAGWAVAVRAALLGALVATTAHSLVIEKLHFRHAWLFLAMTWALTEPPREPARHDPGGNGTAPIDAARRVARWRAWAEPRRPASGVAKEAGS